MDLVLLIRKEMIRIEYATNKDEEFWYKLDSHLQKSEFEKKIRDKQGYVLFVNDIPVGILRYNLFWDNTPFCTLLFVDWNEQKKGYGALLLNHWEKDMKKTGVTDEKTEDCFITNYARENN